MARFPYYRSLSAKAKRIYDSSDGVHSVTLPRLAVHRQHAAALQRALSSQDRRGVAQAAQALVSGITLALGVRNVKAWVLAKRPKDHDGELHGLYTLETDGRAHIQVWMRTAEHETRLGQSCHDQITIIESGEDPRKPPAKPADASSSRGMGRGSLAGYAPGLTSTERRRGGFLVARKCPTRDEKVVAFRTFLRTLLHEVCYHLDFALLGLAETFHTEGFFRRESSLVRQVSPPPSSAPPRVRARQLSLFET